MFSYFRMDLFVIISSKVVMVWILMIFSRFRCIVFIMLLWCFLMVFSEVLVCMVL